MVRSARPYTSARNWRGTLLGWAPLGVAIVGVLVAAFLVLRPSGAPSLVGRPAPNFTVTGVTGRRVTLRDLRGHPVVLNFWGVSCIYCRKEMPLLQTAYAAHRKDGLVVMGIDVQGDDVAAINTFTGERAVTYPQYLQGNTNWGALYNVGDLPESVFIDRNGIVRQFDPKPFLDAPSLAAALRTIL
jgi:peroxiredoxin